MFDLELIAQNGGSIKLTKIKMHVFINNNGVFLLMLPRGYPPLELME
jgi:hypothetical protein